MAKKKLFRFEDMKDMACVLQPDLQTCLNDDFELKGKWRSDFFKNDNPIILELGCGKGEYAVQLGKKYPDKNYIGVDIKGARIWFGATEVIENNMENVGFIRTRIDFIDKFFTENEVDEIWLTFSDPQPNKARKRLSSDVFIEKYRKFLKPGGLIHMKTDSDLLFEYTEEQIGEQNYECLELTWDLYGELPENIDPVTRDIFHIKTHYEKLFTSRGSVIKYCKFKIH